MPGLLDKSLCILTVDYPFFAGLVLNLPKREMSMAKVEALTGMPTGCVVAMDNGDGTFREEMWYAKEFIASLSDPGERIGFLCHEAMHLAMGHPYPWRRGRRKPFRWNAACDYVVNSILVEAKIQLPPHALYDPKFKGMTAEQVYELLPEDESKYGKSCCRGFQSSDGKAGATGSGGTAQRATAQGGIEEGQPPPPPQAKADDHQDENFCAGHGGSDPETTDTWGKHTPSQRPCEWKEEQEQKWKSIMIRSAMAAKGQGRLPGGMERYIDEMVNPKIPWTTVFEQRVSQVTQNDYSWEEPDKRYLTGVQCTDGTWGPGVYIPDLLNREMEVCVVIDASGSIGKDEMQVFISEVVAILYSKGISSVRVLVCDTRVVFDKTFRQGEEIPMSYKDTGGGTDFRPAFDLLEESEEKPKVVVFMTDMMGIYPENEPSFPVIWLNTCVGSDFQPPFGERIDIDVTVAA